METPFATTSQLVMMLKMTDRAVRTNSRGQQTLKQRSARLLQHDSLSHSGMPGRPSELAGLLEANIEVRLSITLCGKFTDAVRLSGAG